MSRPPARRRSGEGFSLVEVLVALAVFSIVAGIVLSVFSIFGRSSNTESGVIEMQQAARVSLDELARNVQQVGYGIDRTDAYNPAHWQRDLVYAGSHILAFNADIDPAIGPLAPSEAVTFPGETYRGEGASATTLGAETYVYTLDVDGDGVITPADRTSAAPGGFNPAADTVNPLDFALVRRTYGYDGAGYGGQTVPISAQLFTNATSDAKYPDGTTPDPLFTYWLTEDLDNDGTLGAAECVVGVCPPTTSRSPQLYLWGDTNFDGKLQEAEKDALRSLPVGSPSWSGNRLAGGGAYRSSLLTADTSAGSSSTFKLADVSSFTAGEYIQVGSGASAETFVIESVNASTGEVTVGSDPALTHRTGETMTVLPQTLLRAVRAVQIAFDAIEPTPNTVNGAESPGRAGHPGSRGLDYRVQAFQKSVELVNLQTEALVGAAQGSPPPACPLTIVADCAGQPAQDLNLLVPGAAAATLTFRVTGPGGAAMTGVPVDFTHNAPALGTFSAKSVKTGSDGKATVRYTTANAIGDDTVTATATCANASQQLVHFPVSVNLHTAQLAVDVSNDCMSTLNPRVSSSGSAFTLSVRGASGPISNARVRMSLAFDPAYVGSPAAYAGLEGELFVGGNSGGTTDASGAFPPLDRDTGATGLLGGSVALDRDATSAGTRLDLLALPLGGACTPDGAMVITPITFYAMSLDSETPRAGCTEVSPCTIPAGDHPPTLAARLTVAGQAAANAAVSFSKTDAHAGSGSSVLMPAPSVPTDGSGVARVQVGNNGSSTITSSSPLTTTVDATSTGDPAACRHGSVVLASPRSQFRFQGSVVECETDIQQAWLSRVGIFNDRLCLHVKNTNPSTGCPIRPTGIAVRVFKTDGVTPDDVYKIEKIEGGAVDTTPSCATSGKVTLFTAGCNRNATLNNGQRWDFSTANGCMAAPLAAGPGRYFVFNLIDFAKDLAGTGRRVDVTIFYQCEGPCTPTGSPFQKTFTLRAP